MSNADIIRAWKDEAFRESLGEQAMIDLVGGTDNCPIELLNGGFRGGL